MSNSARKKTVLKAVRDLDNRVTVADVVATTGLSLDEVTQELNSVAAQSQATLEVTSVGEVFYIFPQNFAMAFYAQGAKMMLLHAWNAAFKALYFLFRISFGVTLLLSFLFIFGTILLFQTVIAAGMGASQEVGVMWRDFFGLIRKVLMRDLVLWKQEAPANTPSNALSNRQPNALSSTPSNISSNAPPNATPASNSSKQGFLLDCYSFLFGEGNPNEHIDDERWRLLAQVIRLNEGIIIAEHLPPYTGRPADDEPALFKVLSKFNGMPRISDSGQLIYVFPNMQQRSKNALYTFMPAFLEEKQWQFSRMSRETLRPVLALAVGNFLGSLFFWWICLYTHRVSQPPTLFLFFAVYGTLFVLVPLVRLAVIRVLNWKIVGRNRRTRGFENLIGSPDGEVKLKLEDAEKIRRDFGVPAHSQSDAVVYTTQKDYLEQLTDNLHSDYPKL